MKVCWFKAVNGYKPRSGECFRQLVRGACETCEYYRENEEDKDGITEDGEEDEC